MEILTVDELTWKVDDNGRLLGVNGAGKTIHEFWVGNPPSPEDQHYSLFVAICDFAVMKGILRQVPVYAVIRRNRKRVS